MKPSVPPPNTDLLRIMNICLLLDGKAITAAKPAKGIAGHVGLQITILLMAFEWRSERRNDGPFLLMCIEKVN